MTKLECYKQGMGGGQGDMFSMGDMFSALTS